jgi:hypothetical protein
MPAFASLDAYVRRSITLWAALLPRLLRGLDRVVGSDTRRSQLHEPRLIGLLDRTLWMHAA